MNNSVNFKSCSFCCGQGKRKQKISKRAKLAYIAACEEFNLNKITSAPQKPKSTEITCSKCNGLGILESELPNEINAEKFPKVGIIGAGIGGVALAVACLHRGIPLVLYERDKNFNSRSQGYGLTLQQASKAIKALGIFDLHDGIVSTKHLVHKINGEIVGEWGMRKWMNTISHDSKKKTNIHIGRQNLRAAIIKQLGGVDIIKWNHKFLDYTTNSEGEISATFEVNNEIYTENFDILIGADGIRSNVRKQLIPSNDIPLRYLNCMVILGICSLEDLKHVETNLLDGETVFQTSNGNDRIYIMPFDANNVMWQLSFPINEDEAKKWNLEGPTKLKQEAVFRTKWHSPIPEIINATNEKYISGYPVYDRDVLTTTNFTTTDAVTLIGDAAHPMSPFKGQGANQAILDALALARKIEKECKGTSFKKISLRDTILNDFETDMMIRSGKKVKDSANASIILHSKDVLISSDTTRSSLLQKEK